MAFIVTVIYICLALLSPWSSYPELANLRPMVWLMALIGVVTCMQVMAGKVSLVIPQIPLLVIFLMLTMLSMAATGWLGGALTVFFQLMVPLAACVALMSNADSPNRIRWLCRSLMLVAVYLSIRAILAIEFGFDITTYGLAQRVMDNKTDTLYTIYRARAVNFLSDPNDFAQFLVACMPLTALLWRRRSVVGNLLQVLIPSGIMLGAIYLTGSRGGLMGLAFLAALSAARLSKFAAPLVGIGVVAIMLAMGFSSGREASIGGGTAGDRINLWSDAIMVARAHPLLGVGYGNILDHLDQTAHNSYLLCLAEIGFPGLYFWLASFSFTMFQLWSTLSDPQITEDARRNCRLAMASLASVMITSFFLSRTYSLTLYIFLGAAIAAVLVARKEMAPPPPIFRAKWFIWNGAVAAMLLGVAYGMVKMPHG